MNESINQSHLTWLKSSHLQLDCHWHGT